MAQITIYVDDELLAKVKDVTKQAGISKSQWIADAMRSRIKNEWPVSVVALAGAWPDFPSAEEIRKRQKPDTRETW